MQSSSVRVKSQKWGKDAAQSAIITPALKRRLVPWLFLAPALIIFTWFKFIPMIEGLVMSFYKVNFNQANEWVGFANFQRAFEDTGLHEAVWHTLAYVLVTMIASAVIAFFIALLLEGPAN